MQLSELIDYRNRLDRMTPLDTTPLVHDKLAPMLHEITQNSIQFPELTDRLSEQYSEIQNLLSQLESTVDRVSDELLELIQQYEASYFEASTLLYTQMMEYDSVEHILSRRFGLTDHARNFIQARINAHGD